MDKNDASDAKEDNDSDGITNIDEAEGGTNPNNADTDNDGVNDAFAPVSENVELLKLMVYNRWGNQVFYTESMDEVWDGTYQGSNYLCADGVYTWYISYKCLAERHEKYGHVNLLR